ncbi:MAG: hypothetical protein WDN10_01515 [bacterium]
MKLKEKEAAIRLRYKGHTLNEITAMLGVAKSSVSLWVRTLDISPQARERIASLQTTGQKTARNNRLALTSRILSEAKEDADVLTKRIKLDKDWALVVCSLLYWCEGEKSHNDGRFRFSNSDVDIIRAFVVLLRTALVLDERKFRICMHLHEYHNESKLRLFWSEITGIPEEQFLKTFWKPHTGKTIKQGYPGCIHITYHDVRVARKISATARAFLKSMVQ